MIVAACLLTFVGLAMNLAVAVWLVVSSGDPVKYTEGLGALRSDHAGIRRLIGDQRRTAGWIVAATALQLAGYVLSVLAD